MRKMFAVRDFPVDLRIKLKAVAVIERKSVHAIIEELAAGKVAQYEPKLNELMSVQIS